MSVSGIPGGITVVMPLYNKGAHVERAIESVLAQTAGFDALIVVDDGSDDDGPRQVEAFEDSRIELHHRSPPGPGGYAARNHAITAASTRWVAFLDADDAWDPDFTLSVGNLISKSGRIGCAFTAYNRVDPSGRIRPSHTSMVQNGEERIDMSFEGFLQRWVSDKDCPIWTGSTCFRRDVLLDAGLFPDGRCRRGGDKDLWLRAMARTSASFDPRPLATYYRDSANMVTTNVKTHSAHCITQTITAMIREAPSSTKSLLKQLNNVEAFNYSISAARSGGLNSDIYRCFYDKGLDYRFYLIKLIEWSPLSLRPVIAKLIQRTLQIGQ